MEAARQPVVINVADWCSPQNWARALGQARDASVCTFGRYPICPETLATVKTGADAGKRCVEVRQKVEIDVPEPGHSIWLVDGGYEARQAAPLAC